MIQFLLGDESVQVDGLAPETSLLDYLRIHRARTGTKEGCASGDCGACTVVLAEPEGEALRYRAVNACITLLGAVHGRQVLTVEHLGEPGVLHPVQQAMVDCHGSQCGFCTPGIVMSLFAWRHSPPPHDRQTALTALSGNLCRCTGYRPILEAAKQIAGQACLDNFEQNSALTVARLREISTAGTLRDGEAQAWLPSSLDELDDLLQRYPQARLIAGGTDLALEATQNLKAFPALIHLDRVSELLRLEVHPGHLLIGAARAYTDCLEALQEFPGVAALLERLGSLQIRQRGTLGGNIANASPIGDMPPVLLALDARLRPAHDIIAKGVDQDAHLSREITGEHGRRALGIRVHAGIDQPVFLDEMHRQIAGQGPAQPVHFLGIRPGLCDTGAQGMGEAMQFAILSRQIFTLVHFSGSVPRFRPSTDRA